MTGSQSSLAPIARFPQLRRSTLRAMRDGAIVACLVLAVAHVFGLLDIGVDAYAYWLADPASPYGATVDGTLGAYFYAPVFAQLTAPIHLLPWQVFIALWTVLLTAALVWQAGLWTALALLVVPVFVDLTVGNIHLLMGAAIVLGFRWPWAWSFLLLTKITPGIGLLWFAFRREWRSLAIALAATAAISAVSFAIAPGLWFEWRDTLLATAASPQFPAFVVPIPFWIRLVAAVGILFWGARTDRYWTVPLASCLALPVLRGNGFAMLVAMLPLLAATASETPAGRWLRLAAPKPQEAPAQA